MRALASIIERACALDVHNRAFDDGQFDSEHFWDCIWERVEEFIDGKPTYSFVDLDRFPNNDGCADHASRVQAYGDELKKMAEDGPAVKHARC
jgi:hypothetical protein